ncbi:hypothetical protein GE107_09520 [Cohnella sp. CFH 77786]|nr:hypothetical protein [Cohnella sp. CFH 77786]
MNRMQMFEGTLYVCTNMGLFYHDSNRWHPTDIRIPCYQVKKQGDFVAAATEYGLWCKNGNRWECVAYPNTIVYELLLTPQYYILGFPDGISLYDRLTGSWAEFPLQSAVTVLEAYRGFLLGVTLEGKLVQGNKKGEIHEFGFEGLSIYSLKLTETGVFVCSSRGLYRLETIGSTLFLRSMLTGYPVSDLHCSGDCMYLATLFQGLKKVELL